MYAYIDECGNNGWNVFDPDQPVFHSVAVIARFDINERDKALFATLAHQHGREHLHAAEMGVRRLESVVPALQREIKRDTVRFFVGKVVKRDLVLTKICDTLFDSALNPAAPWHVNNLRFMRLTMVMKLSITVTEQNLRDFWDALKETNRDRSLALTTKCLNDISGRLEVIPDARSRQIIGEAITWAEKQRSRISHLPNVLVFPPLLHAIQRQSDFWGKKVIRICHDRESLIESTLEEWHGHLSSAPVEDFHWFGETIPTGAVPGSEFAIGESADPGIQLADVVLWLTKRFDENKLTAPACLEFLRRVARNSEPFEFSLRGIESQLEHEYSAMMRAPFSGVDIEAGRNLLADIEQRRQQRLKEFQAAQGGSESSSPPLRTEAQ
jgi:hypothetical protein